MTKMNMDLSELLAQHDQGDFLRGISEAVLQLIVDFHPELSRVFRREVSHL